MLRVLRLHCILLLEQINQTKHIFTGRSSITQGVRTIFADRIKMTMKPKSFDAQGNTRTVIKNIGSGSDDNVTLGL